MSDEELETAMQRIEQCLDDFDKVCGSAVWMYLVRLNDIFPKLEDIPGEVESEKGYKDMLDN